MGWRFDAIEDRAVYQALTSAAMRRGETPYDRKVFWSAYSRPREQFVMALDVCARYQWEPSRLPDLLHG